MEKTVKDNFKSLEYYQKELDRADFNLKRFKDSIGEVWDDLQPIQIQHFLIGTNGFLSNKIKIMYVVGRNVEEIKISIEEYVNNLRKRLRTF